MQTWWQKRKWRWVVLPGTVGSVGLAIFLFLRQPSHHGDWIEEQSILARIQEDGDTISIAGIRDFRWDEQGEARIRWVEKTFRIDQIERLYFIVEPFQGFRGAAHAFLSFALSDGQYLVVSVEARREVGQTYGVFKGMFRTYPLVMVWGTERDLIGLRANQRGNDVFLYPVKAEAEAVQKLFRHLLERHQQLIAQPEFYHTLWRNCTGTVLREVNTLFPNTIPWHRTWVFPENLDQFLYDLNLIDTALPWSELRAVHQVNEAAAEFSGADDFSARLRAAQTAPENQP